MKLNQKLAKKVLAVALTLAMVVTSLFVMPTTANAATGATIGRYTSVKAGTTNTTTVKNLGKNYYAKVSVTGTAKNGVTITRVNGNKVTATTKIQGTGSNIKLNVKNWNVPGKNYVLTVKTYSKSTNKLVRTYTAKSTFVYKTLTKVTLDETAEVLVGKTVTLKATKTPATATTKLTWSSSDETVATVKAGVVTGVKAGTATITVTGNKQTATCTVTVKADLSAKQTAANAITVTGATSDKTADYVVKRGTTTVALKSAVVKDNTVVLTSMTNSMPAGDYTLTYADTTVNFTVEAAKLTAIELFHDNLIATGSTVTGGYTVTAEYDTIDQFGKHIAATGDVIASTAFGQDRPAYSNSNGCYTATFTVPTTTVVGTTTALVITDATTGITLNKQVTISAARTLKEAKFVGLYNTKTGKELTLTNGMNAGSNNAALVFSCTDQYGDAMNAASSLTTSTSTGITVSASVGLTNLTIGAAAVKAMNSVYYTTLPLTGTAATGVINVNVVNSTMGLVGTASYTVGMGTYIKDFTVSPADTMYQGKQGELTFTATDSEGKAVTDYDTLTSLVTTSTSGITFYKNNDGTAKILCTPSASGYQVLTFQINPGTSYAGVKTLTINAKEKCVPTAIIGLKSTAVTGIVATTGNSLSLTTDKLIIEDQYGNTMTTNEFFASKYTFSVTPVTTSSALSAVNTISPAVCVTTTPGGVTASAIATSAALSSTAGATAFTIQLGNATGTLIKNSEYTVTFRSVAIDDISDFAISDIGLAYSGHVAAYMNVTGKYNGATIKLTSEKNEFTVAAGSVASAYNSTYGGYAVTAPTIATSSSIVTLKDTVKVIINNAKGTEVATTYDYSNATSVATQFDNTSADGYTQDISLATGVRTLTAADLATTAACFDQYWEVPTTATRYQITSGLPANAVVDKNNTGAISVTVPAAYTGTCVLNVTYTNAGVTFTQVIRVTFN